MTRHESKMLEKGYFIDEPLGDQCVETEDPF